MSRKQERAHEALARTLARDQWRAARRHLTHVRGLVKSARKARAVEIRAVVARCRAARVDLRARLKAERERMRAALRAQVAHEREAVRLACIAAQTQAKAEGAANVAKAKETLEAAKRAEQAHRENVARVRSSRVDVCPSRSSAAERRSESDDEVRGNIPPELAHLFEAVKSKIAASSHMSRTEAFLKYAEEHAGEALEAAQDKADTFVKAHERAERAAAAAYEAAEREAKREAKATRASSPAGASSSSKSAAKSARAEIVRYVTRGVLGGAYKAGGTHREMRTHAVGVGADDQARAVLCRSVDPDHIADPYSNPEGDRGAPTCPRCLERLPRALARLERASAPRKRASAARPSTRPSVHAPEGATMPAPRHDAAAAYEAKRLARVDRMRAAAKRAGAGAGATLARARAGVAGIPFGQPILVGHHSEKRHRGAIRRFDAGMRKGFELAKKAERLTRRADAAEKNKAISSDDPDAIRRLTFKLSELRATREKWKTINAEIRRGGADVIERLQALGLNSATAQALLRKDFAGRIGIPDYRIANSANEARRLEARIAELEARAKAGAERAAAPGGGEEQIGDVRITEADNRVRVFFPGKPSDDVRRELKGAGFKWAPSVGAWQRHASTQAWFKARTIVQRLARAGGELAGGGGIGGGVELAGMPAPKYGATPRGASSYPASWDEPLTPAKAKGGRKPRAPKVDAMKKLAEDVGFLSGANLSAEERQRAIQAENDRNLPASVWRKRRREEQEKKDAERAAARRAAAESVDVYVTVAYVDASSGQARSMIYATAPQDDLIRIAGEAKAWADGPAGSVFQRPQVKAWPSRHGKESALREALERYRASMADASESARPSYAGAPARSDAEHERLAAIRRSGDEERARIVLARRAFWERIHALSPEERRAIDVDRELAIVTERAKLGKV